MRYWTFDGLTLFRKPERAAQYALDHYQDPKKLRVLVHSGILKPAEEWEIKELEMHMRDQCCPI